MSKLRHAAVLVIAFAFAACAAIQQQHSQPVRTDEGEFKNLKVLPQNIPHDELIATMRGFARAMGRRCDFCHVVAVAGDPDNLDNFDFASDANDHKRIARGMILMVRDSNAAITRIGAKEGETFKQTTCWTCHRGLVHPEITPPPREGSPVTPKPAPQP